MAVALGEQLPVAERSERFVIEGCVPLEGVVVPAGNKNAALPVLAACLLTDEPLRIENLPRIRDVEAMLAILTSLGVEVTWLGEHELSLCAAPVGERLADLGSAP